MREIRLLGKCPNCGAEDSISPHKEGHKASCDKCHQVWEDWIILHLIPVEVDVEKFGARVWFVDYGRIPCARLVVTALNTALMVRFKLGVCHATEGGVQGQIGREPIELRNSYNEIGLWSDYQFENNPGCQNILNWYGQVLRLLFEEELVVEDKNFGRGAILKFDHKDPRCEEKVTRLLWVALYKKTGSKGFADAVFKRLESVRSNPFSGYVAGLTNEQIAEFFVPPPL